jgi:Zn-dependent peptidase ImmA (M78 family)
MKIEKELEDSARELDRRSADFTLSHAVMAVAQSLRDKSQTDGKKAEIYLNILRRSSDRVNDKAFTYYYAYKMSVENGNIPLNVFRYDVIMPKRSEEFPIFAYDDNTGLLSKNCERFLMGHELAHFEIPSHWNTIEDAKNRESGLPIQFTPEQETEADKFAWQLS